MEQTQLSPGPPQPPKGGNVGKKPRRRGLADENNTPFHDPADPRYRRALRAYRVGLWGLIPGLGLVLGPLALLLGLRAHWKMRHDADTRGRGPARAAVVLGGLLWLTTWLGLTLMIQGLR